MNVWKKIISQNEKYGKVGKLPIFLVIACLLLLVACAPTAKPDPDPEPDPEPIEYVEDDFKDVELLDAKEAFLPTIEKVYFNGEIVDYEEVKDQIEYPYFHKVLTNEEIEKGHEEAIKRMMKSVYINKQREPGKNLVTIYGQDFTDIDEFFAVNDRRVEIMRDLSKKIFDGEYGEKFRKYITYNSEEKFYHSKYNPFIMTEDLDDKEFFLRYYQTGLQIEIKVLESFGIEFDPIIFNENPLQFKLII